MERYIGFAKGLLRNYNALEASLRNRIITEEYLNSLYILGKLDKPDLTKGPDYSDLFPQPSIHMPFTKEVKPRWIQLLEKELKVQGLTEENYNFWKKFHLRYKLSVGSYYSQGSGLKANRDDSFVVFQTIKGRRYGQVEIWAEVHTDIGIQSMAIIRPYKDVVEDKYFHSSKVVQPFGGLIAISAAQVINLVGRISRTVDGSRETFLVYNQ